MSHVITLLVIDDDPAHAEAVAESLEKVGHKCLVATSGRQGLQMLEDQSPDVVITDMRMPDVDGMDILRAAKKQLPDVEVLLVTAFADVKDAVTAMQEGAATYLTKPVNIAELRTVVDKALQKQKLARTNVELRQQLDEKFGFAGIIGNNPKMKRIFDQLKSVSATSATVLICGESGTGKELIAKAIHHNSPRRNAAFAPINCAALTETLLESEFFGHEKGSFTGATAMRKGRFEYANGGTVFLDEIASMPLATQAKLLRVLESREITRVGSNVPIQVDVRILTSTNQDLMAMVERNEFRRDLYFRLKVVTINVPPLRERRDDIPLLMDAFIREFSQAHQKRITGLSPRARAILTKYDWPGNVRELRNWVESMVVVTKDELLDVDDLPEHVDLEEAAAPTPTAGPQLLAGISLAEAEKELIKNTLAMVNGNREEAAKVLGIGERTLYRKIDKYGLR
ncbi:MAG: sigma-54-dependent Fis family transcriptional regulator [Planctomycetes bacterium]|nr:sigma-54-dependent Fis family transcriptional regulator [Planctomycetota bacterium]